MEKFKLTSDILSQATQCKTLEEILVKARDFGEDITLDQAKRLFELSHPRTGPVSDDELDNVAGGGCSQPYSCMFCGEIMPSFSAEMEHVSTCHPERYKEWYSLQLQL